jgi:histidinol-phosphate aminotransferase
MFERVKNLTPYTTESARINLSANESFFDAPAEVRERFAAELTAVPFNRYPEILPNRVMSAFAKYYGIGADCVTAGDGSDELISVILNNLFDAGDKVLTYDYDFSMYSFYLSVAACSEVRLNKKNYAFSARDTAEYIRQKKIKGFIFSNPCNPTGLALPRADVLYLADNTDAVIICDEAYMDFYGQSVIRDVEKRENLIVPRTASKAFSSAAMRLGFAVSNKKITGYIRAAKAPYNVNAAAALYGALLYEYAFENDGFRDRILRINADTKRLYTDLSAIFQDGVVPAPSANFVFVATDRAAEIYDGLKRREILVRSGKGFLRITTGTKEENKALINALKEICRGLFNE